MKVKGVRLYGADDLRTEEFELPPLKDDEILLRIISDSLCMSTWKESRLGADHIRVPNDVSRNPIITGHEFSGIIAKVGKKWKDEYTEGEHFAVLPGIPGYMGAPGYSFPYFGGDMTYCIIPNDIIEKGCLLHYSGSSFYEVSMAEPIYCIIGGFNSNYHTTDQSYEKPIGVRPGGNTIILGGCGPMGLGAVSYALALGTDKRPGRIVVTDVNEERLNRAEVVISKETAAEKGVELLYVNTAEYTAELDVLMELTNGYGYDDVFVFAPIRSLAETGNKILAMDGCMNLFAGPADKNFCAEINLYDCHYKRTKIIGSSGGSKQDLLDALDLISNGKLDPSLMITHIGGIDAIADATLNLPKIPGGKKLMYLPIDLPLTAIVDFRAKGKDNELFRMLADSCESHNGLWNPEAEKILLNYYNIDL